MALLKSRGERSADDPASGTRTPGAQASGPATHIDQSTELDGVLRCKDTVRLAGSLKGEIHCEGTVVVAETARVQAKIQAESVIVSGEVRGDICARRKITLDRTARVTGDLETPGIVIEEGAKLEGRIWIGKDQAAQRPARSAQTGSTAPRAGTVPPPPPGP